MVQLPIQSKKQGNKKRSGVGGREYSRVGNIGGLHKIGG